LAKSELQILHEKRKKCSRCDGKCPSRMPRIWRELQLATDPMRTTIG